MHGLCQIPGVGMDADKNDHHLSARETLTLVG
jgi:hypothetical protein